MITMMKCKRILSCLLVVMLILGITPLTAFAYADDASADPSNCRACRLRPP